MKPNGKTEWKCVVCGQPVKHLHEIFYGKHRQASVKYNIQTPVCICSHPQNIHFSRDTQQWKKRLCEVMGIDYFKTKLVLETRDSVELKKISEKMKKKLDSLTLL